MTDIDHIRAFLAATRRRVILRAALRAAGVGLTAALIAVAVLAVAAASSGPAGFWPPLTMLVITALVLAAAAWGVLRPLRAVRGEETAARLVGRLHPALASDLLSAVQLEEAAAKRAAPSPDQPATSAALVHALQTAVARVVAAVDLRALVPMRPALTAGVAALGAGLLLAGAAWVLPASFGRGLKLLFHHPSRFEGAAVSASPLVGDVRIRYEYPRYTGLPPQTVEGSTGDIVAVKGTKVRIETHPLHSARRAALLLGEEGERGEIAATLEQGTLSAELTLNESGSYRFWLAPLLGRPVRELRSHRLHAEPDAPPRVEIMGPADRLDLPKPRPIEVGYAADDDYGIGAVELVFRVGNGPEKRQLLKEAHGARAVRGRTIWDPAAAGLLPGERIAYRVEAKDRDAVSGAKIGSSRTLYVVIQNPHEDIEARLDRQRAILEHLLGDLADRLERTAPPSEGGRAPRDAAERLSMYAALHETEEAHVALLGRLLDDDRREGTLGRTLRSTLAGVADRLGRMLREESAELVALRGRGALVPSSLARIDRLSEAHTAELERAVLLIDDVIGRQRLEDLASLGRELTNAHQRLQDLLNRYKATKNEGLRRELERQARELRARIADLAQKIAALRARNDVPEEWRNLPDTKELIERAKKFDELLERGDERELARALAELGEDLQSLRQMLDQNLEGFGAERFPQENRVVADLMKKIGDLEGDERSLQRETQELADRQEAEVERRLKGQLEELLRKEEEKVERLRQRLSGVETGDPESALSEDVERARDSAKQLKRLLAERDMAEAKSEAQRAASSLDRAADHLAESEARRTRGRRGEPEGEKSAEAIGDARDIAQEIADDLERLLPRPGDTLSPADKDQARAQAERQGSIGNRTDETSAEAARRLGKMPGLDKAASELKGAAARMRQAAEHLKRSEAKQAAGAERDAAERLAKLRDSLQQRTMGMGKERHDPVRIPGADESSAPRAWRQELLDAMKEKAPERYRDEVRRYYEELVR